MFFLQFYIFYLKFWTLSLLTLQISLKLTNHILVRFLRLFLLKRYRFLHKAILRADIWYLCLFLTLCYHSHILLLKQRLIIFTSFFLSLSKFGHIFFVEKTNSVISFSMLGNIRNISNDLFFCIVIFFYINEILLFESLQKNVYYVLYFSYSLLLLILTNNW